MRTLLDLQLARDLANDSALSEADYDVLSTLSEKPQARWRAGELAKHLSWSTSRLTHHTLRMQKRGLVMRDGSPEDGRGAFLVLTESGRAVLTAAAPLHVRSVRRHFIDVLSAEDVRALQAITAKVNAHLAGIGEGPA
jgi:DNA-binding MarR family transcriptional regulator